jgi:hypothetical protein
MIMKQTGGYLKMKKIDKIVFGDNQFFGINHMSQEKAQQLSEKFLDIRNVFRVYDMAIDSGIDSIMLNSNDRAWEICDFFKKNEVLNIRILNGIPLFHILINMLI